MGSDKSKRKRGSFSLKTAIYGVDYDETFAFIAGYTSGGVPYGITWEEEDGGSDNTEELDSEGAFKNKESVDGDIPF